MCLYNTRRTNMYCNRRRIQNAVVALFLAGVISGCGSAYSQLTDKSGLGAGQYVPAVFVTPGQEGLYNKVLGICRNAAQNRQATAAQKAQLRTLTGVVSGAGQGAASGLQFGSILKGAGWDVSRGKSALIGAGAGIVSGLASAFASGANRTADETRRILLNCLRKTSQGGKLWKVLE